MALKSPVRERRPHLAFATRLAPAAFGGGRMRIKQARLALDWRHWRRVADARRWVEPKTVLADLTSRRETVDLRLRYRRRWEAPVVNAAIDRAGVCGHGRGARRLRHRCVRRHSRQRRRRRRRKQRRVDWRRVEQQWLRRTFWHRRRLGRLALRREEMVKGRRAGRAYRRRLKLLVVLDLRDRAQDNRRPISPKSLRRAPVIARGSAESCAKTQVPSVGRVTPVRRPVLLKPHDARGGSERQTAARQARMKKLKQDHALV